MPFIQFLIRGGSSVGYQIPPKNPHPGKISVPKKSPIPGIKSQDFQKSSIPGDKNRQIWDFFGDFLVSKIPNPHPRDWGFFGDFDWGCYLFENSKLLYIIYEKIQI